MIKNNDPKLTAFVLDELSEAEMLEIQKMLDENIELQNEVEEIRSTVSQIETLMKSEPLPTKVSAPKEVDKPETKEKRKSHFTLVELLVVVSIIGMLAGLLISAQHSARESGRQAARPATAMKIDAVAPLEKPAAIADNKPIEDVPLRYAEKPRDSRAASAAPAELAGDAKESEVRSQETEKSEALGTPFAARRTIPELDSAIPPPSMPVLPQEYASRGRDTFGRTGQVAQMGRPLIDPEPGVSTPGEDAVRARNSGDLRPRLSDPYNSANDEAYKTFVENEFLKPQDAPFSTFSIDVDTAAYTTMRRYVQQGQKPPADSVRLEEYVNFFKYDYEAPHPNPSGTVLPEGEGTDKGKETAPFATHVDVAACPWEPQHLLARIGIKGKEYSVDERPPLNLVFLIDTSGSMSSSNRLPLVQRGLTELVEMLQPKDRVAIVTYAGSSRVALPSISGQEKQAILDSINSLSAGGGTAGAEGIKTAYETARKYYDKKAQNRVILCTDGDFNVGMTNNSQLEDMIGKEAKSGVFLTILGFGMGNYKDERLKTLSMRGNGNYGYIDSLDEARRLLVEGLTGTLFAIAKDVKIQVDFNPANVAAYRLLGYENRKLRDEDFHNDKIDAGEIGAGHTVTALYEIVPVGVSVPAKVDESRYAVNAVARDRGVAASGHANDKELLFVKLRYKEPDGDKSKLLEYPVTFKDDAELSSDALYSDTQFAAAAALFGMLLRESRYAGDGNFDMVLELAKPNVNDDKYRKEFVELVEQAKELR